MKHLLPAVTILGLLAGAGIWIARGGTTAITGGILLVTFAGAIAWAWREYLNYLKRTGQGDDDDRHG